MYSVESGMYVDIIVVCTHPVPTYLGGGLEVGKFHAPGQVYPEVVTSSYVSILETGRACF